jgi:hypothetical protein
MSCAWVSLFTNVTWLPRVTVMLFGLTALFAIVTVGGLVPPPPGVGVGDGDVVPVLVEPPPHAATTNASPPVAARKQVAFLHAPIMLALLKPT